LASTNRLQATALQPPPWDGVPSIERSRHFSLKAEACFLFLAKSRATRTGFVVAALELSRIDQSTHPSSASAGRR